MFLPCSYISLQSTVYKSDNIFPEDTANEHKGSHCDIQVLYHSFTTVGKWVCKSEIVKGGGRKECVCVKMGIAFAKHIRVAQADLDRTLYIFLKYLLYQTTIAQYRCFTFSCNTVCLMLNEKKSREGKEEAQIALFLLL